MVLDAPLQGYELQPSELTQPFWDAAREGRLVFQRCDACAKPFFRPEVACPHCFSEDWSWETSSGKATLYSFSVVHRAPSKAFAAPYAFAAVDVEEGWTMFANIIGVEPAALAIGMALVVDFVDVGGGLTVPYFRPAKAA